MKTIRISILICLSFLGLAQEADAQCTGPIVSGHAIRGNMLQGCAPFDIEIINLYSNSTADAEFLVDWGDGTIEIYRGIEDPVDGGFIDPIYTPDFRHTFQANHTDCGYTIVIEATNPCTLPEDARIELFVSVWDTDWRGMAIDPGLVRVCQGFAASVTFQDQSDWNCFPRNFRQNNPPRWIQWEYNGGTIGGVNIPGLGAAPQAGPVTPVMNTGSSSQAVNIPALNPLNPGQPYAVGSFFEVALNNWNQCNPPGNDPVTATARIQIVDTPHPDFLTRKDDASGPVQDFFCVDDIIYFDNRTTRDAAADVAYTWEFFDGPDASYPLLRTSGSRNPTFSYSVGGRKLIRLRAGDRNTVGNCFETVEWVITISPTSIAQINATQTNFCKTKNSAEVFTVEFQDGSIGTTADTEWRWEFFDENDQLVRREPAAGWSTTRLGPFTLTYSRPGVYRTVLYTRDRLTDCYTSDQVNVVVYNNPEAAFDFMPVCAGDSMQLYDRSVLESVNGAQIFRWEWDFDYDGTAFSADAQFQGSMPGNFSRLLPAGNSQVALRVTNDQNGCQALFSREVEVYGLPRAHFTLDNDRGCSPLPVTLTNTAHAAQPVAVERYYWHIQPEGATGLSVLADPSAPGFDPAYVHSFANTGQSPLRFGVALEAVSDRGCRALSLPDTVTALPSVVPGFHTVNYDPFAANCAPMDIRFQVDAATRNLHPSSYSWTIYRSGQQVDSVVTGGGTPQLVYNFAAVNAGINEYRVVLNAVIPNICSADSALRVRVNPVPSAGFRIDTLALECERMVLALQATQQGLLEYRWMVSTGNQIHIADGADDRLVFDLPRPAAPEAALPVTAELRTVNFAYCESSPATGSTAVPPMPDLQAAFRVIPEVQIWPEAAVSFLNDSRMGSNTLCTWDFGDGQTYTGAVPPPHTYGQPGQYLVQLSLEESHCRDHFSASVQILPSEPVAEFSADKLTGCAPLCVQFTNNSSNVDLSTATFRWFFGERQGTSNALHPEYTFYEPGLYTVRLEVVSAQGMRDEVVKTSLIEVYPSPHAAFDVRPKEVAIPDDPVFTTNLSHGAVEYRWDFGDGATSFEFQPVHAYRDTGEYDISLVAISDMGCRDSAVLERVVRVSLRNDVRIPNAFTPSLSGPTGGNIYADGRNDVFYPIMEGVVQSRMRIYNRWGELMFESNDRNIGWDGYYRGRLCPQDVYVFTLELKYSDGREETKMGDVTLLR
jgi:gliding motility-associated-like protein